MATEPRGFDRPDYQSANDAIDMVLATQSMKHKRRAAKRAVKASKREWRAAEAQKLARGGAYEARMATTQNRYDVTEQVAQNIKAADARLETLQKRHLEEQQSLNDQWSAEFRAKEKFAGLQGAERQQAYRDFYSRRSERLDTYKDVQTQEQLADSMRERAQAKSKGYQRHVAAQDRSQSRYRGGKRNARQAHAAYEAAVKTYNALNYVPWSP